MVVKVAQVTNQHGRGRNYQALATFGKSSFTEFGPLLANCSKTLVLKIHSAQA